MNMEERENNILEIRGLTKHYSDFTLQDLNLELPYGCIMGLMGENGAGKSTTIKAALNLIHRDGGTIRMFGEDIGEDNSRLRENIGIVMEGLNLPDLFKAVEVDSMMRGIYRNWDSDCFYQYLEKFHINRKKKIKEYSRGMKIKLALSIALSHNAGLLILDEPTSGLDPVVREEVLDILKEFVMDESHSVLISSHIISDIEKTADYAAFIHQGRLMLCEEKDRLLDEYRILKGSRSDIMKMEEDGGVRVAGMRENSFGAEALVKTNSSVKSKEGIVVEAASLEEIMLFLIKSEDRSCGNAAVY